MKRASITDAKNQLSALLERVRRGEAVLIEDRGVAVARLEPVSALEGGQADVIARLERQGILRPPAGRASRKAMLEPPPRPSKPASISRLVIEERREGR